MNKNDAKYFLPLVQALADGKTIQRRSPSGHWEDLSDVGFDRDFCIYRVKPSPVIVWAIVDSDGRVRVTDKNERYVRGRAVSYPCSSVIKLVEDSPS